MEVVDNQLRDNDPPETRQTYERLLKEGFSDEEARTLIAQVVTYEIFAVTKEEEPFNHTRFVAWLNKLPQPPEY